MLRIILASHGPVAEAMIESAAMLYGRKENISALVLGEDDGIEEFRRKMEELLHVYRGGTGTIILCDIPGGTPCNTAVLLAGQYRETAVLAGMSMVTLLEVMNCDDGMELEECVSLLVESSRENCKRILPAKADCENELDLMMEEEA